MSQDYDDDDRDDDADEGLPPEESAVAAAANRTNAPGIFLIICGVLNIVGVVVWGLLCAKLAQMTVDEYEVMVETNSQASPALKTFYDAQIDPIIEQKTGKAVKDLTPDELKRARRDAMGDIVGQQRQQIMWQGPLFGLMGLAAAGLAMVGGARMRSLRSYNLAVAGACVTAVPCLSCASCPCFLGLIFGIWALVVLLNPDVKNAFS